MAETKLDDLVEKLRRRILDGEFGKAGRIPPHRVLAEQLGTTRETTNKVIQQLQSEGLLVSKDKSVYVQPPHMRMPVFVSNFDRYIESQGLEAVSAFLEKPEMVPAPAEIARLLGIAEGTLVPHRLLRQGVRRDMGVIYYRLSENFYNPELVKDEVFQSLQSNPQFDTWAALKEKYGVVVTKVDNRLIARLANSREQELLEIPRGAPMLDVQRVQRTEEGKAVMVNKLVFVGNFFEWSITTEVAS